jgi:ATP synthase protein I
MAQDEKPPSFEKFDAELRRLKGARAPDRGDANGAGSGGTKWGAGLQVGIELVAGVAGGALLGFVLDRWLGTGPLLLIVFFMLGAVAGTLNAWRWMRRFEARSSTGGDGD